MVKNLTQQGVINLSGVRLQLAEGPTKTLQDKGFYGVKINDANFIPVYLACMYVLWFIRCFGLSAPIFPTNTMDNTEKCTCGKDVL